MAQFGNGGAGFISPLAVPGNRYNNVGFSKATGWVAENSRRKQDSAFTLGGNISLDEYRQTVRRQIDKIHQSSPDAAILLIGPGSSVKNKSVSGCQQRQSPLLELIIEVQKEVARSEHTLFWNWFDFMGGACSIERRAAQGIARPDLIHLSA